MFFLRVSKTVYGEGARRKCGEVLKKLKAKKVLVITGKNTGKTPYFKDVLESIEEIIDRVTVIDIVHGEPDREVVNEGVEYVKSHDTIVAFGGGSVIDTAKMVSTGKKIEDAESDKIERIVKLVAIPTTFGTGSETTCASVIKVGSVKRGFLHESLLPDYAIVDWEIKAPERVASSSGMDAIMHAFEAYTCVESERVNFSFYSGSNEITDTLALKALKMLRNLPEYVSNYDYAREIAIGSNIAGMAFGNAGVHFGHAASYAIAKLSGAPHGVCVSSIGQALMDWLKNLDSTKEKVERIAKIMSIDEIRKRVKLPSLSGLGIGYDDIPELVKTTMSIKRLVAMRPEIDERAAREIFEMALTY